MFSNTVKTTLSAALFVAASTAPSFSATAQDEEKSFIYASYFTCPGGDPQDVDKIVKNDLAPIYDAAVKDGTIKEWGWAAHHTGGKWQRIFTHTSDSPAGLVKSSAIINKRISEAKVDTDNNFGKICNMHDDYIWELTASKSSDTEGRSSISTYYQCDVATELDADAVFDKYISPAYDANIGKGKLTGWSYLTHAYGGKYRRIISASAENYNDLLETMDVVFATAYNDDNPEALGFSKICPSHSDYLWYWQ